MEEEKLYFKFKIKEILIPVAAAIITVVAILAAFYAAISSNYGSAIESGLSDRLRKAEEYAQMADDAQKNGVVFFGDSITEMYDLDKFFPNKNYINRGIGGDLSVDLLNRAESNVIALNPSVVVLLVGTNDLNTRSVEETSETYSELLLLLTTALPDTKFLIESVLPICTLDSPYSRLMISNRTNEKINSLNDSIKEMCSTIKAEGPLTDINYVDTHSVLVKDGKLNKIYALDGLHVNNYGYSAITGVLSRYLV